MGGRFFIEITHVAIRLRYSTFPFNEGLISAQR
jgi:hypothetical protein